jgi:hypothetical protein
MDATNTYYQTSAPKLLPSKSMDAKSYEYHSESTSTCDEYDSTPHENMNSYSRSEFPSLQSIEDELGGSTLKKGKKKTDETKFKTELCKNWTEHGRCNYGTKCKFAHGKHELQEKNVPNKQRYKSKPCNSFHTAMFCPYGSRCLFAHAQTSLDEISTRSHFQQAVEYPELRDTLAYATNSRRLPIFSQICKGQEDESFICKGSRVLKDSFKPCGWWEFNETITMDLGLAFN